MDFYLVRHGEATSPAQDPRRPLTAWGAEEVRRLATWAAEAGVRVDQVRHSGKARAEETATLLGAKLRPPQGVIAVPGLMPMDDVRPVADGLRAEPGSVMLVGHLPFLGLLAGHLLAGAPDGDAVPFPPAGLACVARAGDGWRLRWVVRPDALPTSGVLP